MCIALDSSMVKTETVPVYGVENHNKGQTVALFNTLVRPNTEYQYWNFISTNQLLKLAVLKSYLKLVHGTSRHLNDNSYHFGLLDIFFFNC